MIRDWLARRLILTAAWLGHVQAIQDARCALSTCKCGCGKANVLFWNKVSGQTVLVVIGRGTASDLGDALISHAVRTSGDEK